MKISVYTLGCKANQFESQAIEKYIVERGHELVPFAGPCDACVINTCSVTATGDKKSRQAIRRVRRESPGAIVAVCGCYSQLKPEAASLIGADIVLGTSDRLSVISLIEAYAAGQSVEKDIPAALSLREFENLPAGGPSGRTRAYLKIQDGCSNFCTYCIIPYARGPSRSMSADFAVSEAVRLDRGGYGELILTGIEISSYESDGLDLAKLASLILSKTSRIRLRLGSLEPRTITEDFCALLAGENRLCTQFHLSLQSGCDITLSRMGRKYDTKRYNESLALLRRYFKKPAITTDLITGFPGETKEEFRTTLDFIRSCAFASMHIFPYSERPGTKAAALEGQVSPEIRRARAAAATEVARAMKRDYLTGLIGTPLVALYERQNAAEAHGHAENGVLLYTSGKKQPGSFETLVPQRLYKDGLWASPLSEPQNSQ